MGSCGEFSQKDVRENNRARQQRCSERMNQGRGAAPAMWPTAWGRIELASESAGLSLRKTCSHHGRRGRSAFGTNEASPPGVRVWLNAHGFISPTNSFGLCSVLHLGGVGHHGEGVDVEARSDDAQQDGVEAGR